MQLISNEMHGIIHKDIAIIIFSLIREIALLFNRNEVVTMSEFFDFCIINNIYFLVTELHRWDFGNRKIYEVS